MRNSVAKKILITLFCVIFVVFSYMLLWHLKNTPKSIYENTIMPFNIDSAIEIISETEECIYQFLKNTDTTSTDDFKSSLLESFGNIDLFKCFFDTTLTPPKLFDQGLFFPILKHRDIIVSDATILHFQHKEYVDISYEHLYITETYVGNDENLLDFQRITVYESTYNNNWQFLLFSNNFYISSTEMNLHYLEFDEK